MMAVKGRVELNHPNFWIRRLYDYLIYLSLGLIFIAIIFIALGLLGFGIEVFYG